MYLTARTTSLTTEMMKKKKTLRTMSWCLRNIASSVQADRRDGPHVLGPAIVAANLNADHELHLSKTQNIVSNCVAVVPLYSFILAEKPNAWPRSCR